MNKQSAKLIIWNRCQHTEESLGCFLNAWKAELLRRICEAEHPKNKAHELAVALDQFGYEHDTYDYWDTVDDRLSNIESLERDLTDVKRIEDLKAYLQVIVEEDRDGAKEAAVLIRELEKQAKSLEIDTRFCGL